MLLRFQKAAVRGNYETANQALSKRLRFLTIRELLDQPPHCGLLFAGTHELETIFTRQALELEQWRSRFHAGQALPGISEEEASDIVHSELGSGLSRQKIQKLISKSRTRTFATAANTAMNRPRRLFWVIRESQTVAKGQPDYYCHHGAK